MAVVTKPKSDQTRARKAQAAAAATREALERGDSRAVIKDIADRFPKILARLAK